MIVLLGELVPAYLFLLSLRKFFREGEH